MMVEALEDALIEVEKKDEAFIIQQKIDGTNKKIEGKIQECSSLLQDINKLNRSLKEKYPPSKIEFPKRYFNSVKHYKYNEVYYIRDYVKKVNISYHLLFLDLHLWTYHYFDLYATVKEMLIKDIISLLGNIIDAIIEDVTCNLNKNDKISDSDHKSLLLKLVNEHLYSIRDEIDFKTFEKISDGQFL